MSALEDITHNNETLTRLFELYSNGENREIFAYLTLKNYIDWLQKDPKLAYTTIYTYGNWQESGLYLIVDQQELIVSSLIPNDKCLGAAMKLLDWRSGYYIYLATKQQHDIVLKVLQEFNMPCSKLEQLLYKLPREDMLNWQMTCPDGYEVNTLTTADVDFIESLWPPRGPCSTNYLKRIIDLNVSVALRNRNNGKLVAWCMRCNTGLLSCLEVIDECQRQGLATFVIYKFGQKIAAMGEDVWTSAYETNEASKACFEKSKFQYSGKICYFLAYKEPE